MWAFEGDEKEVGYRKFIEQDIYLPWHLQLKYEKDIDNLKSKENRVEIEKNVVIYERYYHVFKEGELRNLVRRQENI